MRRNPLIAVPVRVIEYELDDPGRPSAEPLYRLVTTILDPDRAPARELAALYTERWEVERDARWRDSLPGGLPGGV